MNVFDTHCHISLHHFDEDRNAVIARMREAGVMRATIAVDSTEDVPFAIKMCEEHDFLYFVAGVHPHNAIKYTDEAAIVIFSASSVYFIAL